MFYYVHRQVKSIYSMTLLKIVRSIEFIKSKITFTFQITFTRLVFNMWITTIKTKIYECIISLVSLWFLYIDGTMYNCLLLVVHLLTVHLLILKMI